MHQCVNIQDNKDKLLSLIREQRCSFIEECKKLISTIIIYDRKLRKFMKFRYILLIISSIFSIFFYKKNTFFRSLRRYIAFFKISRMIMKSFKYFKI